MALPVLVAVGSLAMAAMSDGSGGPDGSPRLRWAWRLARVRALLDEAIEVSTDVVDNASSIFESEGLNQALGVVDDVLLAVSRLEGLGTGIALRAGRARGGDVIILSSVLEDLIDARKALDHPDRIFDAFDVRFEASLWSAHPSRWPDSFPSESASEQSPWSRMKDAFEGFEPPAQIHSMPLKAMAGRKKDAVFMIREGSMEMILADVRGDLDGLASDLVQGVLPVPMRKDPRVFAAAEKATRAWIDKHKLKLDGDEVIFLVDKTYKADPGTSFEDAVTHVARAVDTFNRHGLELTSSWAFLRTSFAKDVAEGRIP
jgi:hypothetical protein